MGSCLSYINEKSSPSNNIVDNTVSIPYGTERKNLPRFTPKIRYGLVVDVYDGDTMTIAARIPGDETVYQFQLRLRGIDCPEMTSKNPSEKAISLKAKEFVISNVLDQIVRLEDVALDKYGRLLAFVLYGPHDSDLGGGLVACRMAVAYDGRTKMCPKDWVKYYETGEK